MKRKSKTMLKDAYKILIATAQDSDLSEGSISQGSVDIEPIIKKYQKKWLFVWRF